MAASAPVASGGGFDIYRDGGKLTYVKEERKGAARKTRADAFRSQYSQPTQTTCPKTRGTPARNTTKR